MTGNRFPVELSLEILKDFVPVVPWTPEEYSRREFLVLPLFETYYRQLQQLASLRGVCQDWNEIICDIIYTHVVLPCHPLYIVRKTVGILRHHADRIQSLTICDLSWGYYTLSKEGRKESKALVDRHLKKYLGNAKTPIQLERLVLEGADSVYMKRAWRRKTILNAPTTVKHLIFSNVTIAVSLALVHLGKYLETLAIRGWTYWGGERYPLRLPKQFQRLQQLVLQDCFIDEYATSKLFGRIGTLTYCPKRKKRIQQSQLRDLRIQGFTTFDPHRMATTLCINGIGKGLTTLHIYFNHGRIASLPGVVVTVSHSAGATAIAKECQSLIDFRYAGTIERTFFRHLSKSLKVLALAVWAPSICSDESTPWWQTMDLGYFTPENIGDVISLSDNRYHLERLIILIQCWPGEPDPPASFIDAVNEGLEAVDIPFEVKHLRKGKMSMV
ncbi:hypothetical protein CC1G_02330 [Coprinopsis cinerea okayama7|uniref:F-box domain-containing protein n=1 Tax=Coprinopsis cinerea (strain Okayama-7 / 130 / ATCC MYA-4618 / FGSC 9003) TaxID=240176 RepID=A8N7S3_COPC7|nr:hypothetical protein CC1G_02330 [Coprinopsis cinerea okayama7\|eukprot:XP_001830879.2 hypothetical protein CC1G_02330 [Coprinopsis cinerea okayama7\